MMAEISLVLNLFITISNAFLAKNQSSITKNIQNYSNNTESPLQPNYTAPSIGVDNQGAGGNCCDAGCFVNCSISGLEDAEYDETCYESSPPSLFDNYWCENIAADDDFYMNGQHGPLFSSFEPSTRSYCYSFEAADFSSWYASGQTSSTWRPTFTSPCCDLFSCDLAVATASLIYWPTPAPVPNITSIVSSGYTFISPSAYVVFQGAAATNDCGLIGSSIASTMVAFDPSDLSTGNPVYPSVINYAQLLSNCTISPTDYSADSYSVCFPQLIMPRQIWKLNTAWSNCNGDTDRSLMLADILDPPRALVPTSALLAPGPTKISNPPFSAAPASAPLHSLAPVTSVPINSSPLPASNAQLVPPDAETTALHGTGDPEPPPQSDPPSHANILSPSVQGEIGDSTQPQESTNPQFGGHQPTLQLHAEGGQVETNQASHMDLPPSPSIDGIDRAASPQPIKTNAWENGGSSNPMTRSQPQQIPVLTFADSIYTADTATHFIIAGETLVPGSSINALGTPIYLASDGVVAAIGSGLVKQSLLTPNSGQLTGRLIIAGATYTADSASHFIIAGQTLSQGGAITVSNTPISLATGGAIAIVGMSSQILAPPAQELTLKFGGSWYTADASSAFSIGSQILIPGGAMTISDTPISLVPGGTIAVVGTSSQLLASIPRPTQAPTLTFNGVTYTADASSVFTLKGHTLTPGGSLIVSGTPISLAVGGTIATVGTSIQLLTPAKATARVPILTFEGTIYTADTSSAFTINGQTLTTGGIITANGTPLSLDADGLAVVIGSSTQMLGTATITGSEAATIHLGSQTYTEESGGDFVVGGQTLTEGGEITVGGTLVSFAAGGTGVVIGSNTETVGIGGWIMGGLGPGAAQTEVVPFEGKGAIRMTFSGRVLGVIGFVEYCILML